MPQAHANPTPQPSEPDEFRFQPTHYLYAVVLFASSVAAFRERGILPGCLVVAVWAIVFTGRSRPRASLTAGIVAAACLGLSVLFCTSRVFPILLILLASAYVIGSRFRPGAVLHACVVIAFCFWLHSLRPTLEHPRDVVSRSQCKNNLKQIGLALHNYHDVYRSFPPANVSDENGRPMHSWRVLLLPYLDGKSLYDEYDFSQPWDGPHNRTLLSRMPDVYACPSASRSESGHGNCTNYVAVVGSRTNWPGSRARSLREIEDGTSNTVLVIEGNSGNIPWVQPRDVSLDEALRLFAPSEPETAGGHRHEDFLFVLYNGRHILLADGSAGFVQHGVDRDLLSALLVIDDGAGWPDSENTRWFPSTGRLKLDAAGRVAVFLLLVFLPLPWVWLKRTGDAETLTS